jgi:hypothetical protein
MTEEEKQIIRDVIIIASKYANGGVKTFVYPNGRLATNYVPFRNHQWNWSDEYSKFVLEVWKEIYVI